jgi:HK97 family phage portal protein
MRLFGLTITRTKEQLPPSLSNVDGRGGWWPLIREPFAGAWQRNLSETVPENVLAFSAVYACVTLIAKDIAKLRIKLVQQDDSGIWSETENPAFSPVLRKPNRYQHRIAFLETWMTSKLIHGNTYVLKQRDGRGVVVALYVLDPTRVQPKVAPDGAVYYAISQDALSGVEQAHLAIPASEIIHDMMPALYHPLVGVSPITACGKAAIQGLRAQNNSSDFFGNSSIPSGVLSSAQIIDGETATRLQQDWQNNFTGENYGKVAVLGAGLEYKAMSISAEDAQLIEQLKWAGEDVCRAYHIPAHMVGFGATPTQYTVEAMSQLYYAQCLQNHIERIEVLLDEGLGLAPSKIDGVRYGVELDLDDLLRMDTPGRVKAAKESINSGGMAPNEARKRFFDLGPTPGGETPYMQEQNWPLRHLANRPLPDRPITEAADAEPDQIDERDLPGLLVKSLRQRLIA